MVALVKRFYKRDDEYSDSGLWVLMKSEDASFGKRSHLRWNTKARSWSLSQRQVDIWCRKPERMPWWASGTGRSPISARKGLSAPFGLSPPWAPLNVIPLAACVPWFAWCKPALHACLLVKLICSQFLPSSSSSWFSKSRRLKPKKSRCKPEIKFELTWKPPFQE